VYEHIQSPSSQTHIAFSFDSLPYGHEHYFQRRAAVGILSDGMSSRLFDRVREKRGLCYTISANCHSLQKGGAVFVYAGTTPERAQDTLDVAVREIENLADDLDPSELDRWKVRVESSLIMEQESSASKASSMASDQLQLGRVMSTSEIEEIIESITIQGIREEWHRHPPGNYRIVTLGENPLRVPTSLTSKS
jgi:predicted Zn-dependent peptidase